MTPNDSRVNALQQWLTKILNGKKFTITVASADASFRRYFRIHLADKTLIAMDAPPESEDIQPFIKVAKFLHQHQVHVPKIHAQQDEQGFLLLDDLGDKSYFNALNTETATLLYQQAIDEIIKMQQAPLVDIALPDYDRQLLTYEMQLFPDWFLQKHLNIPPPDLLHNIFELLVDNAYQQPWNFVHRDYHSRNMMLIDTETISVIDFQDAVIGPISYDLVSLLRDCYVVWPTEKVDEWIEYYYQQAKSAGLLNCDQVTFKRWFDLMGLQRHLKVLGIFCRLNYRDGKAGYMNDLPLTLHYVLQVTEAYPELAELHKFLINTPEIMAIKQ